MFTQLLGDFDRTSDAEAKVWTAGGVGVGDVLAEVEDCGAGGAAQREAEQKGGWGEDGRIVVGVRHRQEDSGKRLVVGVVRNGGRIREKEKAATGWVPPLENSCREKNNEKYKNKKNEKNKHKSKSRHLQGGACTGSTVFSLIQILYFQ